jgi:hypothetical protein
MFMGVQPAFPERIPFELRRGVLIVDSKSVQREYCVETEYRIQDPDGGEDLGFTIPTYPLVELLESIEKGLLEQTHQEFEQGLWNADIYLVVLRGIGKILMTYPPVGTRESRGVVGTIEEIEESEFIFNLPPPIVKIPFNTAVFKSLQESIVGSCMLTVSAKLVYVPGCWVEYEGDLIEFCPEGPEDSETQR